MKRAKGEHRELDLPRREVIFNLTTSYKSAVLLFQQTSYVRVFI